MHYKIKKDMLDIKHRLRFDFRMIKPTNVQSSTVSHRVRYLLGATSPIKSSEKFYLSIYEECFFNTEPITKGALSENWAALMFGVKINKVNKFETGPLYITWKTGSQSWFNQYYWQFTWISRLNFTIKN